MGGKLKNTNRLINEKSPYLLQHAHNPVDWYPWGKEAFEKAEREDKPIFLSIGYSTCHWCHVMEEESFEDEQAAEILNRNFVSIKVDKEERPDIDAVYMNVCQSLTGSGGWPLTIIMTPEQKPFFAGTYFPKTTRYGMPGIIDILNNVIDHWKNKRDDLIHSGERITRMLNSSAEKTDEGDLSKNEIRHAYSIFEKGYDSVYGGFGGAPKFPTPHNLMFLLRYSVFEQNQNASEMAYKTLKQMYRGGIFDHIGFGFSRYSTDDKWLVPHFEKMLYDNALLSIAYLEAFKSSANMLFLNIAKKILLYVEREMTDAEGGFYSAQDADSDGIEGKYYIFTPDQIKSLLGDKDGDFFCRYFDISEKGNFEGLNIPNLIKNKTYDVQNADINRMITKLYEYRLKRTQLHKDDKILTSWNAVMIAAFTKAYQVTGEEKYLKIADNAINFIEKNLSDADFNLNVRYRDGESYGSGFLDDYAYYIWALLSQYDATYDTDYLQKAMNYTDKMIELFYDRENGGFFLYRADGEALISRPKEVYDGAMPSGNSVAGYVLARLSRLTANKKYNDLAFNQLKFLGTKSAHYPAGYSFTMMAGMQMLYPSREIVCVCKNDDDVAEVREVLSDHFLPNDVIIIKKTDDESIVEIAGYLKDYTLKDGKVTYYVCENHVCSPPITDMQEFIARLQNV